MKPGSLVAVILVICLILICAVYPIGVSTGRALCAAEIAAGRAPGAGATPAAAAARSGQK